MTVPEKVCSERRKKNLEDVRKAWESFRKVVVSKIKYFWRTGKVWLRMYPLYLPSRSDMVTTKSGLGGLWEESRYS